MTEKRPLFRPEAVEYHAKARTSGRTLDLKERRTVWVFRGTLLALLAIVLLAFTITAETTAHGVAAVTGSEAHVVVGDTRRVKPGQEVTVEVGGTTLEGTVVRVGTDQTTRLPVVVVALTSPAPGGSAEGTARIRLGRTPIAKLLMGKR